MYQKKSRIEAENEAKKLSLKYPEKIYYVVDKKHGRAACYSIVDC